MTGTLLDDGVLTGAVRWYRKPVDLEVHTQHVAMLDRLAESGVASAHEARKENSPLLYVVARGFTD